MRQCKRTNSPRYTTRITEHFGVRKAQYPITTAFDPLLTLNVTRSDVRRVVRTAVDLDRQLCCVADKIDNERPNHHLTTKMSSGQLHTPQLEPQRTLRRRHRFAKTPSNSDRSIRLETRSDARRS